MYGAHGMPQPAQQAGMLDAQYGHIPSSPGMANAAAASPMAWPESMQGHDGSGYDPTASAYTYDPNMHANAYAMPAQPVPMRDDGTTYFAQQW